MRSRRGHSLPPVTSFARDERGEGSGGGMFGLALLALGFIAVATYGPPPARLARALVEATGAIIRYLR